MKANMFKWAQRKYFKAMSKNACLSSVHSQCHIELFLYRFLSNCIANIAPRRCTGRGSECLNETETKQSAHFRISECPIEFGILVEFQDDLHVFFIFMLMLFGCANAYAGRRNKLKKIWKNDVTETCRILLLLQRFPRVIEIVGI